MPDVFFSYANEDREVADRAIARLESEGMSCWVSHRDAKPGSEWAASIVDAIESSRIVVLIYTVRSNESQQVLREMERAVVTNVPILPFLIEDQPLSKSMSYFLGATHWLNAANIPLDQGLDKLTNTVQSVLRAKTFGLRPAPLLLPASPRLKQIYCASILVPLLLFIIAYATGSQGLGMFSLTGAFGVPFGIYGLLWGRASWRSSLFFAALFALGAFFVATVIVPLL